VRIILQSNDGRELLEINEIEDLDPEEFLCSLEEAIQVEKEQMEKVRAMKIGDACPRCSGRIELSCSNCLWKKPAGDLEESCHDCGFPTWLQCSAYGCLWLGHLT
jgi:hypothetical protein